MSLTSVDRAIKRHLRPTQIARFESEGFIRGQYSRTFGDVTSIDLARFPLTDKDLRYLPEGVYTFQDFKLYEIGSGTIPNKSEMILGSERFEIKSFSDRSFEGNYTHYLAKRITDDTVNNT
jgi:hypothetical protein